MIDLTALSDPDLDELRIAVANVWEPGVHGWTS